MPDTEESGQGGAEQAFEDLRAEVKVLRRAVESLPEAWAANRPANYTATLGQIAKGLEVLAGQVRTIEQHPAIHMTPVQHQQAILRAGEGAMDSAVRKLDSATADAVQVRHELAGLVGSMRGQQKQFEQLFWTGLVAAMLGLLISPLFARLLPFGIDGRVAAFIMHADRWNAGAALMEAGSPEGWQHLKSAADLLQPNEAALTACRDAAAKMKKEQHCTVVVPAP
jgi:Family of unknown function (DUF6118)